MHSHFRYAKTLDAYNYDYSSDRAIWAISVVHYWCTHAFQVANCNGFYFNACPLGLTPDGSLCLSMVLLEMSMSKFCTYFSPLCTLYNHIFRTDMTVVSPIMSMLYEMYVYNFLLMSYFIVSFNDFLFDCYNV